MLFKHFVEFIYPEAHGSSQCKEIEERDADCITVPVEAYGYRFYDQEYDVEQKKVIGERKNYSGTTYYGKVYALEEIKREHPKNIALIFYMEFNGYEKVVKTRTGELIELQRWDTVIEDIVV